MSTVMERQDNLEIDEVVDEFANVGMTKPS